MTRHLHAKRLAAEWICFAGVIAAWWLLSRDSANPFFPPLQSMLADAHDYWTSSRGLGDARATLANIAAGFFIGVFAGVTGGIALGRINALYIWALPGIELLRSIPGVILLPITISFLGIGDQMKILNIALGTMWPILVTTMDGYRGIPEQWLQTARVYGLGEAAIQRQVVLPALVPHVLTGIQVAIPLSLIVGVTSEMVGATVGIGSVILNAQYTFDVSRMWSGVILLAVLGYLLNSGFSALRAVILKKLGVSES